MQIDGTPASDVLTGTPDADVIRGGDGDDTLNGGDGDDVLEGGRGRDDLNGGNGRDQLRPGPGGAGFQSLAGGAGADDYFYERDSGSVFVNNLGAAPGEGDRIVFDDLALADVWFGIFDYRASAYPALGEALQINWADPGTSFGEARIVGDRASIASYVFADGAALSRIELDAASPNAPRLYGTAGADRITGNWQDGAIHGGDGADVLDAGGTAGGRQYLFGEAGDDRYVYHRASGTLVIGEQAETAGGGSDTVQMAGFSVSQVRAQLVSDPLSTGQALQLGWDNHAQGDALVAQVADAVGAARHAILDAAPPLRLAGSTAIADRSFASLAAAQSATISGNSVRLQGYAAAGDGGEALYVRAASEPATPGKFQSADGSWWQMAEPVVRPEMFGAHGGDGIDDVAALRKAAQAASALGVPMAGENGAVYEVSSSWDIEAPLTLYGNWTVATLPGFSAEQIAGRAAQRVVGFYAADIRQADPASRLTIDARYMPAPTLGWFSDPNPDFDPDSRLFTAAHGEGANGLDLSISVLNSAGGGVYIAQSSNVVLRNVYADNVQTVNSDTAPFSDLIAVGPVFGFYETDNARILGGLIEDRTDKGYSFKQSTGALGQDLWAVGGHAGHASHYMNRVDGGTFVGGGEIGGPSGGSGTKIYDSHDVTVEGMRISGAASGITVEMSDDVEVTGNQILFPQLFGVGVYAVTPEKVASDGAVNLVHDHSENVRVTGNQVVVPVVTWTNNQLNTPYAGREFATYSWGDPNNSYVRNLVSENNSVLNIGSGSVTIANGGSQIERFEFDDAVFDAIRVATPSVPLIGTAAREWLVGGDGADILDGGFGADRLDGGAGIDTARYAGAYGGIWVDLATGIGRWNAAEGDRLVGIENLVGTAYADILSGDAGDNILSGGAGADMLAGAGGTDTADYGDNYGAVWIDLATGIGRWNYAEGDRLSGIENLVGTAWGDRLGGDAGVNRLIGGAGDDILSGGFGGDLLIGGDGIDTADYTQDYGGVSIDLGAGIGRWNAAEGDRLTGIEQVVGTDFSDRLQGDAGVNRLEGGAGDDWIAGGAGADWLDGGAGNDTLDYGGNYGAIWIDLQSGIGRWNYAEGDRLLGFENVIGTEYGDWIAGSSVANRLTGGGGDDLFILAAQSGNDVITDFRGNGAAPGDTIRFLAGIFSDFAAMLGRSTQQGDDVVIRWSANDSVTLQGVHLADLAASDFMFG